MTDAKLVLVEPAHSLALLVAASECDAAGFDNVAFVLRELLERIKAAQPPYEEPVLLSWAEIKRRWPLMTEEQRSYVLAKQRHEGCSRLAVARDWPGMFAVPPKPEEAS